MELRSAEAAAQAQPAGGDSAAAGPKLRCLYFSEQFKASLRDLPGYTTGAVERAAGWTPECAHCGSTIAADRHGTFAKDGVKKYVWTQWAKCYVDRETGDRYERALCSGCWHKDAPEDGSAVRGSTPFTDDDRLSLKNNVLAYFADAHAAAGAPPAQLLPTPEGVPQAGPQRRLRDRSEEWKARPYSTAGRAGRRSLRLKEEVKEEDGAGEEEPLVAAAAPSPASLLAAASASTSRTAELLNASEAGLAEMEAAMSATLSLPQIRALLREADERKVAMAGHRAEAEEMHAALAARIASIQEGMAREGAAAERVRAHLRLAEKAERAREREALRAQAEQAQREADACMARAMALRAAADAKEVALAEEEEAVELL